MIRGLVEKTLRETRGLIAIACAALGLVLALFVQILPQFQDGLNELLATMPFFRRMISGLMGVELGDDLSATMLVTIAWAHPVVLALVWGFEIALCTRVPAGEIEHGTIDVLLGWPVSRAATYLAETLVWLAAGALLLACGATGFLLGLRTLEPALRPDTGRVLLAVLNLGAVYAAVGAFTLCVAAASDRRGRAVGIAVGFVLASFLLQFLGQFWTPAERLAFASFTHYYRPAQVMLDGRLPTGDVLVLLAAAAVLWAIGLAVWRRRSVCTV